MKETVYTKPLRMPDDISSRTTKSIKIIEDDKSIIDVQKLINGKWVSNETDRGISLSKLDVVWKGEKLYLEDPEKTDYVKFYNICKITPAFTQEQLDNIYDALKSDFENYNQMLLLAIIPQICYGLREALIALGYTLLIDPESVNLENYILATPFKFEKNIGSMWYTPYFREFLQEHDISSTSDSINSYDFIIIPKDVAKTNPIESALPITILFMHVFADAGILVLVDEKHDIYLTRFQTGD